MTTQTDLVYQHQPIEIFDLKCEPPTTLIERVDETGLSYLKSLAKDETATLKQLKRYGVAKPEERLQDIKRFINASSTSSTQYKQSENIWGLKIPSRLWAHNKSSVQSIWGPARNILIGKTTLDIDQSNAWMRQLLFIVKELRKKEWTSINGTQRITIITTWLEDWILNKKSHITNWMMSKSNVTEKGIKKKLACIANWNGNFKTGYEPFQKLNKELQTIETQLKSVPEFKDYVLYCTEKFKANGKAETLIGILTKAMEANLTWACVRECQARSIEICLVLHDGFHPYKKEANIKDDVLSICNAVSEYIAPECAIWTCKEEDYRIYDENGKPTTFEFKVPDNFLEKQFSSNDDNTTVCSCGCKKKLCDIPDEMEIPKEKLYCNMKHEFEKLHCQVHCHFIDEEKKFPEPCICDLNEIKTKLHGRKKFYRHSCKVDKNGKEEIKLVKENFFPEWNDDEDKRYYRDYDVYPDVKKCPDDVYNLWQGYAVFRKSEGKKIKDFSDDVIRGVAYFYRHIHRLIDDDFRDFFWEYWCHLLKYPGIKPGILLGLIGLKRIGKGQALDMLSKCIGPRYYCMTSHPGRDVWGSNGTDYCDGKMLCRLAEPKESEYKQDPGAMRVWITDNPVERKAMHKKAETIHNYTRFIHDGNEPVLPDEENGGRVAQTLCNPYWKDKWIDDPQQFVEYNTSLGQYIDNELVQVLLTYMILKLDCPTRFSFHRINEVTGNFAKEERKRNRTLIERFIIYLCEQVAWDKKELDLIESDIGTDGDPKVNTIEYHLIHWSRVQSFREPMKARSITTMLGNWMAMKHGGIKKERPWNDELKRFGHTHYIFDLNFLRNKFALDKVREQCMKDSDSRNERNKNGPLTPFLKTECCHGDKCTCSDKQCHMSDEDLLNDYITIIKSWVHESDDFEKWLSNHGQSFPQTYNEYKQESDLEKEKSEIAKLEQDELVKKEQMQKEKNDREQEDAQCRYDEWNQETNKKRKIEIESLELRKKQEVDEALQILPDSESMCTTSNRFGGPPCDQLQKFGKCMCDSHSSSCKCLQCRIRESCVNCNL